MTRISDGLIAILVGLAVAVIVWVIEPSIDRYEGEIPGYVVHIDDGGPEGIKVTLFPTEAPYVQLIGAGDERPTGVSDYGWKLVQRCFHTHRIASGPSDPLFVCLESSSPKIRELLDQARREVHNQEHFVSRQAA